MAKRQDTPSITIDGKTYDRWTGFTVNRGLTKMASGFRLETTEGWLGLKNPWNIQPWARAVIRIGDDPILTGTVEVYEPDIGPERHPVGVEGRSLTGDLVECMPDVPSGQYKGYGLIAICTAVCGMFFPPKGIQVVAQVPDTQVADATIERAQTAYAFLERLCRLAAVLPTDDELGRFVLTRTGAVRSYDALRESDPHIIRIRPKIDVSKRFSRYTVKGQTGLDGGVANYDGFGGLTPAQAAALDRYDGIYSPAVAPIAARISPFAVATDSQVPRFRPHVSMAESGLDATTMQQRANWQAAYAAGRSLSLGIDVKGWRQSNGDLWKSNLLVPVVFPSIGCVGDMVIADIKYSVSAERGPVTSINLAPPAGFTPDPASVKRHKNSGKDGPNWSGWGGS